VVKPERRVRRELLRELRDLSPKHLIAPWADLDLQHQNYLGVLVDEVSHKKRYPATKPDCYFSTVDVPRKVASPSVKKVVTKKSLFTLKSNMLTLP